MPAYSRVHLSGSTDGKPINITGTNTGTANTVHTAVSGSSSFDEIYLWVSNTSGSDATLTIEWGAATDPGALLTKAVVVPANSPPTQIAFGQPLNNGAVVKAFSGTTAVLNLTGYVNRIS